MSIRPVKRIVQSTPTMEGAGVKLHRAFGFGNTGDFDPFLLLDDFRNDRPEDYRAGFPWHPHRGIETITYVLSGTVEHADSLGNKGRLGAGDVQWMTAGSGIMHQEMPQGDPRGRMHGFQLWANLPSSLKMTTPRYQDIPAIEIPETVDDDGTTVRVICGDFAGKRGPVDGIAAEPRYLDIFVPPGRRKTLPVETWRHAFAYVFEGSGSFAGASKPFGVLTETETGDALVRERTGNRSLVLFEGAVVELGHRLLQLCLGVHHDRAVPGDRLLDGLARNQEKPDAVLAGLHRHLVALRTGKGARCGGIERAQAA
jgi:redox-sensitive bicupin YhaK (pirin superfamily)